MGLTIYIKNNDSPSNISEIKIICTYNEWNKFRKSIIRYFITYLEEQIILNTYKSLDTKEDIIDFISNYYQTIENDTINFDNFNKIFDNNYINLFILYKYYGFYIFINKEDNNSCFSIGNSYDMMLFFNLIESYIEESNKEIFNTFKLLLKISIENKKKIFIE